MEEAGRCFLCECRECVKNCLYLETYHGYPKSYINDISSMLYNTRGLSARSHLRQLNSCSLCGLCKQKCPNQLNMGDVCLESKKMISKAGDMPAAYHDFWMRDMDFSMSDDFALARNFPSSKKSRYFFFPGCQLAASDPDYVKNTYYDLCEKLKGEVGLFLGCCGAPAEWAGRKNILDRNITHFIKKWRGMDCPAVILACPTCHKIFKKYYAGIETIPLWDVLLKYGLPKECAIPVNPEPLALYDPCASRYFPGLQKSARELLTRIGYPIEELKLHGKYAQCCSFGGLVSAVNPDLAQIIIKQRIGASKYDYVTYCSNCRDDFASHGKPTWHLLDILFGREGEEYALRTPPTKSQRRDNRRDVKIAMLDVFWGEKTENTRKDYEDIKIKVQDDILKKADDKYILMENVKEVIYNAEKTGIKIIEDTSRHYIAHSMIGIETIWVEYKPGDNE